MERIKLLPKDVLDEIFQKETGKTSILYEILYSKRLLIEHVEVLEECLYDIEGTMREDNFLNPICAGGLMLLSGVTSLFGKRFLAVPLLSTSYSLLYLGKYFRSYRIKRNKECLQKLLKSIEEFENVIKKHILFFNELQRFKTGAHIPDDGAFVHTCLQCLKDVILTIYDGIKELETEYNISQKYELVYEPIENLCQTDYFLKELNEFNAKHIKEFLNLFLYVQSQYLMRLGLIIATGNCESDFVKYNTINLTPMIDEQISNCSYNFDLIMFVASPDKINHQFKKISERKVIPMDLLRAKSYSLTFVPKLLAVTHQCMRLDSVLNHLIENYNENDKEQDEFHELVPIMSQLDSELLMCQDEYQRLFITYQKFLNMGSSDDDKKQENIPDEEKVREIVEHDYRKVGETAFGHHDEFFALDVLEDEVSTQGNDKRQQNLDEDEEMINRKIVKRTFRPVLKQLRRKIEPLADDMKERERKVLVAKGVDLEKIDNGTKSKIKHDLERESNSSSERFSSEDDDSDEEFRRKRTQKSSQKYSEMREFLEQKQQLNVFALKPTATLVSEDVIE